MQLYAISSLQTFLLHLRGAGEHLDEIVVQAIVKLTLERPFKLRIGEVARVEFEIVGVNRNGRVLEGDDEFDRVILQARVEGE